MTSMINKPLRRFMPILRNYYLSSYNVEHSYTFHYTQKNNNNSKHSLRVKFNTPVRTISSSNLAKCCDKNRNNPRNEQKTMLDDVEFQSILSDFAKDFDVGSDSEQILDEIRQSLDEPNSNQTPEDKKSSESLRKSSSNLKEKFKEFSDRDSAVIPSYEDLQVKESNHFYHISQETESDVFPLEMNLKRGIRGVFDIEEMVDVLKKENLDDIAVISVPKELCYADFLVIVTAKSPRHSKAVCERVLKLSKMKKDAKDPFFKVEGEDSKEWKVIDMRNIVLHIFLEETRTLYDIESLWLFDSAFDQGGNLKDDPLYTAIEQQMSFFNSINENLSANTKQKPI